MAGRVMVDKALVRDQNEKVGSAGLSFQFRRACRVHRVPHRERRSMRNCLRSFFSVLGSCRAAVVAISIVLVAVSPCSADVVQLSGGREIQGVVLKPDADPVLILTAGGNVHVARERIEKIEKEADTVNLLLQAEFQIRCGNAAEAARLVHQAQTAGATPDDLRVWSQKLAQFLQAALVRTDGKTRAAWVAIVRGICDLSGASLSRGKEGSTSFTLPNWNQATDGFTSSGLRIGDPNGATNADGTTTSSLPSTVPNSPSPASNREGFYLTMSRTFAAADESPFALEILDQVSVAALRDAATTQTFVRSLMVQQLVKTLDARNFRRASALIERMEAAGLGLGRTVRILLCLRWAAFERERGNYTDALSVLDQRLKPLSPALTRERMIATLAEARQNLTRRQQYEALIRLYGKWGPPLLGDGSRDVEADLCQEWGRSLLKRAKWGEARMAFAEYYKRRPPAPEAQDKRPLLDLCAFQERLASLDRNDYAGAFELGQWAAEHELTKEAVPLLERAAQHPDLKSTARARIAVLRKRIALELLADCMSTYEKGKPKRALEDLEKIQPPADPDITERFAKLRQLCAQEMKRQTELRSVQAAALLEDVQRRLLQGQESGAVDDLEIITRTFSETPSARTADRLLQILDMRRDMQRLEGRGKSSATQAPVPTTPDLEASKEMKEVLKELEGAEAELRAAAGS
jgi:hypothetical protein